MTGGTAIALHSEGTAVYVLALAIMELPSDRDGRFWPFVIGGLLYALLLIPLA